MPVTVKVGCTTRRPNERAAALDTTGVPTPFQVYACWIVPNENLLQVEKDVHNQLSNYRIRSNREFFKIEPDHAKSIISQYLNRYDEVEKQRNLERRKRERAAELNHKRQIEILTKDEWEEKKNEYWDKASREAENQYGMTLNDINSSGNFYDTVADFIYMVLWFCSFGIIPLLIAFLGLDGFFESNQRKKSTIMMDELFAIRAKIFKQYRRNHFSNYNVEYPFNDLDTV